MKQINITRVFKVSQTVVSRLLKKHKETDSVKESKRSAFILECKGLLVKRHGMLCIFIRPQVLNITEFSKVSGRTSGIRC